MIFSFLKKLRFFLSLGLLAAPFFQNAYGDVIPPAQVTDLTAVAASTDTIELTFTMTGDDGMVGESSDLSSLANEQMFDDNNGISNVAGLVGGLGFQLSKYQLDYAFTPFGSLGETHRFSLSASF